MSRLRYCIVAVVLVFSSAWAQPPRPVPDLERIRQTFTPLNYRGEKLGVIPAGRGMFPWKVLLNVFVIPDLNYYDGKHRTCAMDILMPVVNGDELGGKPGKPRPVIFFVHGGGWSGGGRGDVWWTGMPIEYATKGYVTVSVDYRLSGEAAFPAAVEDVKNAVRWVRAHAKQLNLDSERFAAVGHSAGGHLVMCLGAIPEEAGFKGETPYPDVTSKVHAVVSMAGVSDMAKLPIRPGGRRSGGAFLAGPEETFEERSKKASPIHYVSKEAAKFLLIHGTDDAAAPFVQSTSFKEALEKVGAPAPEALWLEGGPHNVRAQYDKVRQAMDLFFERNLKR